VPEPDVRDEVRCYRCSYWCGETAVPLRLVGVLRHAADLRALIPPPRQVWRCPNCGWQNVFEPFRDS